MPIRVVPQPQVEYVDTPGVLWGDPRQAKWKATAKPEGLAVGLIQSVASPTTKNDVYKQVRGRFRRAAYGWGKPTERVGDVESFSGWPR